MSRIHSLALAVLLLSAGAEAQTTWFVDVNGTAPGSGTAGNPYTSIQFAIQQPTTLDGDTVRVLPGTYFENIDLLGKEILLESQAGRTSTFLDGSSAGSVVTATNGEGLATEIRGFTIQNGQRSGPSNPGGGVFLGGFSSLTLRDCTVRQCVATYGGGVAASFNAIHLRLDDCVIEDNQALSDFGLGVEGDGGGVHIRFTILVELNRTTLRNNSAGGNGGGLFNTDSEVRLVDCTVENNTCDFAGASSSPSLGGGLFAYEATTGTQLDLTRCHVEGNQVIGNQTSGGGAVYLEARGTIRDCRFAGNGAGGPAGSSEFGTGGGLVVLGIGSMFSAPVLIEDTLFEDNLANGSGGGVYCDPSNFTGHPTFRRCLFRGNQAQFGAALRANATPVIIEDSRFTENQSIIASGFGTVGKGAGVHGPADLLRCELDHNECEGDGGGAYGASLVDCDLHHNRAHFPIGISPKGGGASNCTLVRCRIRNNIADGGPVGTADIGNGGGLFGCQALECEIHDNRSKNKGIDASSGGGASTSDLERCTVYRNAAPNAAGVAGGSVERCTVFQNMGVGVSGASFIHNSIVRGNTTSVLFGSNVSYSNIEGGHVGVGNIDAPEAFIDPVGGPEGTGVDLHFSSSSSPGVNSGDPASPLDPDGSRADMGAYPYDPNRCSVPAIYCRSTVTAAGCEPRIGFAGTPSLTGSDDFHLDAWQVVTGKNAIFFWGTAPTVIPFQGATLCVAPPIQRTPPTNSGGVQAPNPCLGTLDHHFTQAAMLAGGLTAGTRVYGQFWFRDNLAPSGTSLTDAVWWTTCP